MSENVHEEGSFDLSERDRELLHALQVAPRVSWAEAARILDSTPAALARRWARLRERGLAWVTAHPGGTYRGLTLAMVEVDCLPGRRADVVRAVCADPRAVTVEESTRGRDLMLTVITPDLLSLTRFVLDELERLPGVERQRTYLATTVHRHGTHWRIDALTPAQVRALEQVARVRPTGLLRDEDRPLLPLLALDGRRSAADLARLTGRNPATVRRQLARVVGCEQLSFRTELASSASGWSVSSNFTAHVDPVDHARTVTALATLPELRLCLSTTGETNLVMTTWTRSLDDLLSIEQLLGEKMPWLRLHESAVNLRTPKRMGWLLDEAGRATGEVVVPSAFAAS
jgi:DNA-binding Lrp family transcriptional regulator